METGGEGISPHESYVTDPGNYGKAARSCLTGQERNRGYHSKGDITSVPIQVDKRAGVTRANKATVRVWAWGGSGVH